MWRVVGIGMELLRHDGEVEGVVVKDDAVLEQGRFAVNRPNCYPLEQQLEVQEELKKL